MTEGNSLNDRHTGRQRFDGIFTPKTRRECVRPRIRLFGFVMRRQPGICRLSSTPYCGIMMWEHSLASACPCVPQCARRRHVFNFRSSLIITARTQRASEANADGTRCGSLSLSRAPPRSLHLSSFSPPLFGALTPHWRAGSNADVLNFTHTPHSPPSLWSTVTLHPLVLASVEGR